jgi:5'-nucleotidase
MKLLMSNDDGVNAPGLAVLYRVFNTFYEEQGDDITVIAPDRNCSAASNGLTLMNPLRVETQANGFISVNGTPADCVHLGINQLSSEKPDLVIAGINKGANLGDDVIYSGTVAAATEGRHMGLPAIAVSLVGKKEAHYETAAQVALRIVKRLQQHPLKGDQILNINVPDVPMAQLKGIKVTRLGSRYQPDTMSRQSDPWGRDIYWYGPIGRVRDNAQDTDFYAISEGYASVTPLTVDMTAYQSMTSLTQWINEVKLS